MLLHCMRKTTWETVKDKDAWGEEIVKACGCIHCSPVEWFWRVAPNFKDTRDELVLICIDEDKLLSEIRYEDDDNCGRRYPHVYGVIRQSAVVDVLPFLRDDRGRYIKNPELAAMEDR